jgi:hypothetical protein
MFIFSKSALKTLNAFFLSAKGVLDFLDLSHAFSKSVLISCSLILSFQNAIDALAGFFPIPSGC